MTDAERRARIRRLNELAHALYDLGGMFSQMGAMICEEMKREINDGTKKSEPTDE